MPENQPTPKKEERTPAEVLESVRRQAAEGLSDLQKKKLEEVAEAEEQRRSQRSA